MTTPNDQFRNNIATMIGQLTLVTVEQQAQIVALQTENARLTDQLKQAVETSVKLSTLKDGTEQPKIKRKRRTKAEMATAKEQTANGSQQL